VVIHRHREDARQCELSHQQSSGHAADPREWHTTDTVCVWRWPFCHRSESTWSGRPTRNRSAPNCLP